MKNALSRVLEEVQRDGFDQLQRAVVSSIIGNEVFIVRDGQSSPDARSYPRASSLSSLVAGDHVVLARIGKGYVVVAKVVRNSVNLIANPTFEVNADGWNTLAGLGSIARDSTHAHSGTYSLKIVTTTLFDGARYNPVTVVTGATYSYSCWVYAEVAFLFGVNLTDNIDQGLNSPTYPIPADAWTFVSFTATVDTHTARQFSAVYLESPPIAFWIDEPSVFIVS